MGKEGGEGEEGRRGGRGGGEGRGLERREEQELTLSGEPQTRVGVHIAPASDRKMQANKVMIIQYAIFLVTSDDITNTKVRMVPTYCITRNFRGTKLSTHSTKFSQFYCHGFRSNCHYQSCKYSFAE